MISRTNRNSLGKCSKSRGFMLSGPGLFFFSKPSNASEILFTSIQSLYFFAISATAKLRLLLYVVCLTLVAAGKCVFVSNSMVSEPGSVLDPSGFVRTLMSLFSSN